MADTSAIHEARGLEEKITYASIQLFRWQNAMKVARPSTIELMDAKGAVHSVDALILEPGFEKLRKQAVATLTLILERYEKKYFDLTGKHYGR